MDVATLTGYVVGFALILGSIVVAGSPLTAFIDIPSTLIVIGGAIASTLVASPLKGVINTIGVVKKCFFNKADDVEALVSEIVDLSETARRDGLLALEGRVEEVSHPFIATGLQLAIDGSRPEVIEEVMRTEIEAINGRHRDGKFVIDQLGRFAPAFGMIGTLIGLVIMLGSMDDPSSIGGKMAVALLTTLYGAVVSNLMVLPLAEKLALLHRSEMTMLDIIMRGVISIQSGDNPRVVEQKLATFIPPSIRKKKAQEAA